MLDPDIEVKLIDTSVYLQQINMLSTLLYVYTQEKSVTIDNWDVSSIFLILKEKSDVALQELENILY